MFFVTIVTRNRLPRAVHWTQPNQSVNENCLLALLVVIAAVVVVLAVFCWIDGIPAANQLAVLVAAMR
jgi:hypothetical protein